MKQPSLLKKLLVLFAISGIIFVAKIFLFEKYFAQEAPANSFVPAVVEKERPPAQSAVQIGGKTIKVEVVDTPAERERGLSGHPGLKDGEGLLFVFENTGKFGFWMKDMLFAIDMIWINEQGEIVYIQKNATPESYPEIFTPTAEAKYVLEVVAGFTDENNISVGDQVGFSLVSDARP